MEQAFTRRPWLLPALLALLTIIFFGPVIFPPQPGQVLSGNDFNGLFYPLHNYIRQIVLSGELPLWNPRQFLGHPIIGNPHSALFYPATWFMWAVGVERGMDLSMVFHAWLGAWGMAMLARSFKSSYVGALLAGIIYGMSGWTAARFYVGHYNLFVVYGWLPWMMVAYRYALERRTWRSTVPGMAVTGAALLAGYPPLVLYAGLCMVTLWVYHIAQVYTTDQNDIRDLIRAGWYAGIRLTLIVFGGLLLGAALVIPTLELSRVSERSETGLAFANSYAMPPAQYLDLALPFLFGSPRGTPFYWGAEFFEEMTAYCGLLPLLAVPLAFRLRRSERWYFVGLVGLGLVLSIGVDGVLLALLVWWIPGFSSFRVPARAMLFIVIALSGLTALLITALQNSTPEERRAMLHPAVRLWLPVAVTIAFGGAMLIAGWYAAADQPPRLIQVSNALATAGMILVGVWFVLWLWSNPDPKVWRFALLATCILVTLDAWHVGIPLMLVTDIVKFPLWVGAQTYIPLGTSRVLNPGHADNIASVTGHLDVSGFDALTIDAYAKMGAISDGGDPKALANTLMGVKYLISEKPYDKSDFKLLGTADGGYYYERTDPFPRTWVAQTITVQPDDTAVLSAISSVKDPYILTKQVYLDHPLDCPAGDGKSTTTISEYRPDDVQVNVSGNGGVLVLTDQFYSGWGATVGGKPADVYRADTVFRAVCVPAGDHVVRFEYRPLSLYIGMIISAISWLAVLVLAIIGFRQQRRPKIGEHLQI